MSLLGLLPIGANPVLNSETLWVPDYKGFNQHARIPDWICFRPHVILTYYTPTLGSKNIIGRDGEYNDRFGFHDGTLWFEDGSRKIHLSDNQRMGLHTLNINQERILLDGAQIDGASNTSITDVIYQSIGLRVKESSMLTYFDGQLHTIHLIDQDEPLNSRFYESIILSKEMPATSVLTESLGHREDIWGKHDLRHEFVADDLPAWYLLEGTYSAALEPDFYTVKLGCHNSATGNIRLRAGDLQVKLLEPELYVDDVLDTRESTNTNRLVVETMTDSARAGGTITVSVEKANDGQLINFGPKPWTKLIS